MESPSVNTTKSEASKSWLRTGHWSSPYCGYVHSLQDADAALKNFSAETQSRYIVYQKDKTFGAQEFNLKKCRIFFQATEERQANSLSVWPEFDGIPFIVLGRKVYGCHLGKDKDYGAKRKLRETKEDLKKEQPPKFNLRTTKKIGCPAKVSMAHIVKFPQYKVNTDNELARRAIFKELHRDLSTNPTSLELEVRFYIRFNKPEDHVHARVKHGEGDKAIPGDRTHTGHAKDNMDYRLVRHLCKLHHQGVTRLSEIETALSQYINRKLYPNGDAPSSDVCPELHPDQVEIQYHLNKAKCVEQLIHIDTKIFNKVVEEWRQLYPTHSFYYQAYVKEEAKSEQQVKEHQYARDMIEPGKLQSFMFCYQSDTQQRLLARFGQNLTVLDLAKNVPVPTYFLMVRTNTCYQVVGIISMQFPYPDLLEVALEFLRDCNPGWQPECILTRNTQQDIAVLQQVFPNAEIHIIDSCRENSWTKWLDENTQGKEDQRSDIEEVHRLLQLVATSKTKQESDEEWKKLTETSLWTDNVRFRYYMINTWKSSIQRWSHYSRSESLMMTLLANDGLNLLTSALKHDWLDDMKTRSLTEIFSGIVSEYLPAHYCKHMSQNLVLPAISTYTIKTSIPDYIKPMPPIILTHVMELLKSMPRTAEVSMDAPGQFTVEFSHSPSYKLRFGNEICFPFCECSEWQTTRMVCQHFCIVFASFPDWGWSKLSVRYTNNPIFAVDEESLPDEMRKLFNVENLQQQAERALQVVEMETVETDVILDNTVNLPSPVESDTDNIQNADNHVQETPLEAHRIADTDILVASETVLETEAVLETELLPTETGAIAESTRERTEDPEVVSERCKYQLERLGKRLEEIEDVDTLLRVEQWLVEFCDQVGQRHDRNPTKRLRVDE